VLRAARLGRPRVTFVRFPYFVGERAEMHFGMSEGGAHFLRARYALTRVQEADLGWRGGGLTRRWTIHSVFEPEAGVLPGPEADVRLVFDVPVHAPGTSLSARLPSYWELRVVGDTTAGPFDERFLLPIYERTAVAP
jgi:hypothetical protein